MPEELKKIASIGDIPPTLYPSLEKWWRKKGKIQEAVQIFAQAGFKADIGNYTKWCATLFPIAVKDAEREFFTTLWSKTIQALRLVEPGKKNAANLLSVLSMTAHRLLQAEQTNLLIADKRRNKAEELRNLLELARSELEAQAQEELESRPELFKQILEITDRARQRAEEKLAPSTEETSMEALN